MAQAVMIPSTDMLDSYHQTSLLTRPEAKRLTQLEQEMANVLSRTDISDRQKMDLFGLTLENFKRVRGEIVNNGLMLTATNAPQPPLKESETDELFDKIQDLINRLNNPQSQATPNINPSYSTASTAKLGATTPAPSTPPNLTFQTASSTIGATPQLKPTTLTIAAKNLQKELTKHAAFRTNPKNDKIIIGGIAYPKTHVHAALIKMTSDDGYTTAAPHVQSIAQKIYKTMMNANIGVQKVAHHQFFKDVVANSTLTPRTRASAQQTPTRPKKPSAKKPKSGSGASNLVDFHLWDTM